MGLDSNIYLVGIYMPRHINIAMSYFVEEHTGKDMKVDRHRQCITMDGNEYHFVSDGRYEMWIKGKTYWHDGKLYHSGYEVREHDRETKGTD